MYADNAKDSGHISLLAQRILQRYLEAKAGEDMITTTTTTASTIEDSGGGGRRFDDHHHVARWPNNSTFLSSSSSLSSSSPSLSSYYKVHLEYNQTQPLYDHPAAVAAASSPVIDSLSSTLVQHISRYASSTQSNQSVSFDSESASLTVATSNKATDEAEEEAPITSLFFVLGIGIFLCALILATMVGNALVIAAILRERHLRSVGNYLVFSLAVADLMVACFVMPLGALYAVTGQWTFGAGFCDLWTVADVLCCTASILHLLAIAVDRYWAVTNVDYIHQRRNSRRIGAMIFLIWFTSLIISLAPIFGWRDQDFHVRISQKQCLISQDVFYQIVATCSCFFLPLLLILLLYWKIFKVARKRIRHKPGSKVPLVAMQTTTAQGSITKIVTSKKGKQPNLFKLNYHQQKGENNLDTTGAGNDNAAGGGGGATTVAVATTASANNNNNNNNNNNSNNTNSSLAKSIARQRLMRLYGKAATAAAADEERQQRPCPSISENNSYDNEVAEESNENYFQTDSSSNLNDCLCGQLRYNNQANSCNNNNNNNNSNNNNGIHNKDGLGRLGRMLRRPQPASSSTAAAAAKSTNGATTAVVPSKTETKNKKYNQMHENANNNNSSSKKCKLPQESQHLKSSSTKIGEERLTSGASSSSATTSSERPLMSNEQGSNASELEVSKDDVAVAAAAVVVVDEQYNSYPNNQAEDDDAGKEKEEEEAAARESVELKSGDVAQNENDDNDNIECSTTSNNNNHHQLHHQATIISEELNISQSDAIVEIVDVSVVTLDGSIKATTTNTNNEVSQMSSSSQCGTVMCANLDPETLSLPNSLELSSSTVKDGNGFYNNDQHQNHHHHHQQVVTTPSAHSLLVCPVHNKAANAANDQSIHWHAPKVTHKETIESKRERKAAKTLAIITGVFIFCWLPFFINALLSPLWKAYQDFVPPLVINIFLWLGYLNSGVNPVIYTIFSPDFRMAFKKMLLGKKSVRSIKGWSGKVRV